MRLLNALAIACAVSSTARAQSPVPTDSSGRVQFGVVGGIAKTRLSVSVPRRDPGIVSVSGDGTSPYFGVFARRTLTPSLHVGVQANVDLKGDDGARYSIPYVQLPLQIEFTPFAPRDGGRWVRPMLLAGLSTGVRLSGNGGEGEYSAMRPFELSSLVGVGVEAHFRTRDWVQLGVVVQDGLTDLQPKPGTTESFSIAAYIKVHPGAMRRR